MDQRHNSRNAPPKFRYSQNFHWSFSPVYGSLPVLVSYLDLSTSKWRRTPQTRKDTMIVPAKLTTGQRLIEVYPRPRSWDIDGITGYYWRAHRCECDHNCNPLLNISQVCRESRRIFERVEGNYAKYFGTHISWERDILYIGDRTGHLHNTGFLKTVELAGGLGKVKNLAVHEDVWVESKERHDDLSQEFRRCGPVGAVQQLGVEHLTSPGKAGFFRDGTEFYDEVDERDWLWNSDTEADDYDHDRESMLDEESDDNTSLLDAPRSSSRTVNMSSVSSLLQQMLQRTAGETTSATRRDSETALGSSDVVDDDSEDEPTAEIPVNGQPNSLETDVPTSPSSEASSQASSVASADIADR